MMNKKTIIATNKKSEGEESAMVDMCDAVDNLCLKNQILEDNLLHIK